MRLGVKMEQVPGGLMAHCFVWAGHPRHAPPLHPVLSNVWDGEASLYNRATAETCELVERVVERQTSNLRLSRPDSCQTLH